MLHSLKWRVAVLTALALLLTAVGWQKASADEFTHIVKGTVKSVDKASKTMVVKTADGTEHSVKWTEKTTWEGMKDTGEGVAEGSKVTVKYTEKAGEKTAVGVKTAGKATGKALSQ